MDISIKNLKKYVFEPKTELLRVNRAKDIVSQNMIVTEKVDGTKLTLVFTEKRQWIVAYKGSILHAKEFAHLSASARSDIDKSSIGIGQYYIVFDHLKRLESVKSKIPVNTEFSVEFAQNKDTLTRTYEQKGGMFLRSYGRVHYRIVGGELHTSVIDEEITDYSKVKQMADLLQLSSFPIFHRGDLSKESIEKNPLLAPKMKDVNWENPIDVLTKFSVAVLSIPSALGGTTEGVVLKLSNGQFFKLVQDDQYDAAVRGVKKDQYRLDPEAATAYFQQIRALIGNIFKVIGTREKSSEDIISDSNFYLARHAGELGKFYSSLKKIAGGKKNEVQINDDIHDTIRLLATKRELLGTENKTLGLIPIAGKPLHIGHWKLIELAAKQNDAVVIYTSSSDRVRKGEFPIKGDDFVRFWTDFFIPVLPKNVKVKFVDSPVRSVMHELGWFEQTLSQDNADVPVVNLYSDSEDIESNFKDEDLKKYPNLLALDKIKKVGVKRTDTVNVSGTKMREFLTNGDKEEFFKYLPPLSNSAKESIWQTLLDSAAEMARLEENEEFEQLVRDAGIRLLEGGWRTADTQKTVITPHTVAKIVSAFEEEFITDFNKFSGVPPIKFGGPVGSAAYYKQDLGDPGITYGDVDVQLILPVESNNREEQLASNKLYREKILQFIQEKKPSYIIPHLNEKDYGLGWLVFKVDGEAVQVDLVISYTITADWTKTRTTPQKGLKGFVTGQLLSALSSATRVVLGANTNPHIKTKNGPVFFKSDEIFLEMLKYFAKLAGSTSVDTTSLKGHYGLDPNDPSFKKKCESIVAFANALMTNGVFEKDVLVAKDGTVFNSRDQFVTYILDAFIEDMENAKVAKKLDKADTPEAMKNIEKIKQHADLGKQIAAELIKEEVELITESGASVASVDPKTPKTVNGQPAQATTKLKIVDASGKDIHSSVSADVKELVYSLNEKVRFWKKNNPYIENGFIFNGSSQYLMDPQKFGVLSKYKDSFGDIDIIVPKQRLDRLKEFLEDANEQKQVHQTFLLRWPHQELCGHSRPTGYFVVLFANEASRANRL